MSIKSVPTNQMYHGKYGNYGMNKEEVDMRDKVIDSVLATGCFDNLVSVNGKTVGSQMKFWFELSASPTNEQIASVSDYFDYVNVISPNVHGLHVVEGVMDIG